MGSDLRWLLTDADDDAALLLHMSFPSNALYLYTDTLYSRDVARCCNSDEVEVISTSSAAFAGAVRPDIVRLRITDVHKLATRISK